uniref:Uncharacterized protein n=1 Tax=Melanopsichium pennsylvanicum 4 TaxID=1398559 RepID=A0A077QWY9_9BASI|nr:uncharacterized protein BN887_05983 [Melanopsichium pennsylvanicum 4]
MVSYRALLGILVVPICALAHPFNSADIREVDRGFIQTERSHSAPGPEPVGLVRTSSDDEALDGHSSTRGHGLSDRLLLRRSLSSTSSEGGTEEENSQAEAEMRGILRPLGMHLGDSHAEPIAAWRLSEASLLDGKISDENLKHMLYGKWMTYIRQHPQVSLESEIPGPQATLWKYITTDEGARFGSASNVIE